MTLMEALVVVAVTVLITLIGYPALRGGGEAARWRQAQLTLVSDVRAARADALRTDRPVALEVARGGRSYGWTGAELRELPGEVILTAPEPIVFYTNGSSSGGTVFIRGAERVSRLLVDPATGTVQLAAAR